VTKYTRYGTVLSALAKRFCHRDAQHYESIPNCISIPMSPRGEKEHDNDEKEEVPGTEAQGVEVEKASGGRFQKKLEKNEDRDER